jgi:hypothetical protein
MTILPPGLSCSQSGRGTWSAPQVTRMASNGAASGQPRYGPQALEALRALPPPR